MAETLYYDNKYAILLQSDNETLLSIHFSIHWSSMTRRRRITTTAAKTGRTSETVQSGLFENVCTNVC